MVYAITSLCATGSKQPIERQHKVELLSCEEKMALITGVVLSALVIVVGVLILLANNGVNLGQISGIGSLGNISAYVLISLGGTVIIIDIITLLVQMARHINRLFEINNNLANNSTVNELGIEVTNAKKQIQELQEKEKELEIKYRGARNEIERLGLEAKQVEDQHKEKSTELSSAHKKEMQELEAKAKTLQTEIDKLKEVIQKAGENSDKLLQERVRQVNVENEELKAKLTLQNSIEELKKDLEAKQNELKDFIDKNITPTKSELDKLNQEKLAKQQALKDLEEDNKKQEAIRAKRAKTVEDLTAKKKALYAEIETLKNQEKEAKAKNTKLIEEAKKEAAKLRTDATAEVKKAKEKSNQESDAALAKSKTFLEEAQKAAEKREAEATKKVVEAEKKLKEIELQIEKLNLPGVQKEAKLAKEEQEAALNAKKELDKKILGLKKQAETIVGEADEKAKQIIKKAEEEVGNIKSKHYTDAEAQDIKEKAQKEADEIIEKANAEKVHIKDEILKLTQAATAEREANKEEILKNAQEKAEKIVENATHDAQEKIDEARRTAEEIEKQAQDMKVSIEKKAQIFSEEAKKQVEEEREKTLTKADNEAAQIIIQAGKDAQAEFAKKIEEANQIGKKIIEDSKQKGNKYETELQNKYSDAQLSLKQLQEHVWDLSLVKIPALEKQKTNLESELSVLQETSKKLHEENALLQGKNIQEIESLKNQQILDKQNELVLLKAEIEKIIEEREASKKIIGEIERKKKEVEELEEKVKLREQQAIEHEHEVQQREEHLKKLQTTPQKTLQPTSRVNFRQHTTKGQPVFGQILESTPKVGTPKKNLNSPSTGAPAEMTLSPANASTPQANLKVFKVEAPVTPLHTGKAPQFPDTPSIKEPAFTKIFDQDNEDKQISLREIPKLSVSTVSAGDSVWEVASDEEDTAAQPSTKAPHPLAKVYNAIHDPKFNYTVNDVSVVPKLEQDGWDGLKFFFMDPELREYARYAPCKYFISYLEQQEETVENSQAKVLYSFNGDFSELVGECLRDSNLFNPGENTANTKPPYNDVKKLFEVYFAACFAEIKKIQEHTEREQYINTCVLYLAEQLVEIELTRRDEEEAARASGTKAKSSSSSSVTHSPSTSEEETGSGTDTTSTSESPEDSWEKIPTVQTTALDLKKENKKLLKDILAIEDPKGNQLYDLSKLEIASYFDDSQDRRIRRRERLQDDAKIDLAELIKNANDIKTKATMVKDEQDQNEKKNMIADLAPLCQQMRETLFKACQEANLEMKIFFLDSKS